MVGTVKSRTLRLRYHAVSIVPGKEACPPVLAMKGARLLSAEAPRLPMPGCTQAHDCACRFVHHEDRRAGPRREGETDPTGRWATDDRRKLRGRRDADFE